MPNVTGTWPGRLTLKSGWSRAHARPWNDVTDRASMRLGRGSSAFLRECALWLLENAAPDVLSVPLTAGQVKPWKSAGFQTRRKLMIMERDLSAPVEPPESAAFAMPRRRSLEALAVDRLAFSPEWRIDRFGLEDALSATPTAVVLGIEMERTLAGYAVCGLSASTGYLQRIAVSPEHGGSGLGRSLLRESLLWARRRGAFTMLLNTDNAVAAGLYRSEGFEELPDPLVLMGMTTESSQ